MQTNKKYNKLSVINDPIYGFISIPDEIIFKLIDHPYFQRLRRIAQLGLTHLVYPGANHSRFQHAIGAMHLIGKAIHVLKQKGIDINEKEELACKIAILLHDIGHGPFSHTLEYSIIPGISHEDLSSIYMDRLNQEFDGKLDMALAIFRDDYPKKFLHQLVSSQLDMDRLDYLHRDGFFSGVSEGTVNINRIINKLNVFENNLAVEYNGIYSVEQFLVARRLMYWQVYLHKTSLSAEFMLIKIFERAKFLHQNGEKISGSDSLKYFLKSDIKKSEFISDESALLHFSNLDDIDLMASIKQWANHNDAILSFLSSGLINRELFKVEISANPLEEKIIEIKKQTKVKFSLSDSEIKYFVSYKEISNKAYTLKSNNILILYPNGETKDISEAADLLNISAMSEEVYKYCLCYPKP